MLQIAIQFIAQYGYIATYILMAAGLVGLPLPEETTLTFIGSMTVYGPLNFSLSLLVCFLGTMTGMLISYFLGKKIGKPILYRMGKWIKLTPARLQKTENWFQKYGTWTVAFGYFVPGVRHLTCYLSGISGIPLWRYILFAGPGAFLWCMTFLALGRFIGNNLNVLLYFFREHLWESLTILLVFICIGITVYFRFRRRPSH